MKRRGFLGFLGGAAVAGPGMVKEAAAQTLADLSVSGVGGSLVGGLGYGVPSAQQTSMAPWAADRLAKLVGRTAAQHAFYKARTEVYKLVPDLAANRSMALHRKIGLQRDRDYERSLEGEHSSLEATIAGWFD